MITSIAVGAGTGLVLGLFLVVAAKRFAVQKDPLAEKLAAILPGINCGACGYPGCSGYSEALARGEAAPNLCAPGGQETADKLSAVLGKEAVMKERVIAVRHCNGSTAAVKPAGEYLGVKTCAAAVLIGGPKVCRFSCVGYGDCVLVCPVDAIHMGEGGLPVINEATCIGCGACVQACPRNILSLIPESQEIYLACSTRDKAKTVKDYCSRGCMACGLCAMEKITPSGAVTIVDNLPEFSSTWKDYSAAAEKCPASCFVVRVKETIAAP